MSRIKIMLALGILFVVAERGFTATATAKIVSTSTNSIVLGQGTLTDSKEGLKISVEFKTAPVGVHAFHIHEFGMCDDSGKAAGGHFNPLGHQHGDVVKNPKEAHFGDLGNITINKDGTGKLETTVPGLTLAGSPYTVAGRAFILHEKTDDFGQPVGNAGSRIGCGVITISGN